MTTVYDRIETLLRLDAARSKAGVPQDKYRDASGAIADHALGIINELAKRLEEANQFFQEIDDLSINNDELSAIVSEGIDLTDIVQDYTTNKSKTKEAP